MRTSKITYHPYHLPYSSHFILGLLTIHRPISPARTSRALESHKHSSVVDVAAVMADLVATLA